MSKTESVFIGTINNELKIIKRLVRVMEGLSPQAQNRVMTYVQRAVWEEGTAKNQPAASIPFTPYPTLSGDGS